MELLGVFHYHGTCRWFPCADPTHQQGPSISCSGDGLQVLRPSMSPSFLGRGHEGPTFPSLRPAAALPGPWHQPAPNHGTTWTPASPCSAPGWCPSEAQIPLVLGSLSQQSCAHGGSRDRTTPKLSAGCSRSRSAWRAGGGGMSAPASQPCMFDVV